MDNSRSVIKNCLVDNWVGYLSWARYLAFKYCDQDSWEYDKNCVIKSGQIWSSACRRCSHKTSNSSNGRIKIISIYCFECKVRRLKPSIILFFERKLCHITILVHCIVYVFLNLHGVVGGLHFSVGVTSVLHSGSPFQLVSWHPVTISYTSINNVIH